MARACVACGLAGLALCWASPASAAPAWLAPVDLSVAGQNANNPQVAFDPAGNAIAVWTRSNGTNPILQSAARPVGGPWQAPLDVSLPGADAGSGQVAVDAAGNAIAVWTWTNTAHTASMIQSAVRPAATGVWQPPVDVSAGSGGFASQIAVDPAGDAVAVWQRSGLGHEVIQAAVRPASSGIWQTPIDVFSVTGEDGTTPQVAVDVQGNAVVVFRRNVSATHALFADAAVRPASTGFWQPAIDVSTAGDTPGNPKLAVDPQGDAIAAWASTGAPPGRVRAAVRPITSGVWQAPVDLSPAGEDASAPSIAADAQGNTIAAWQRVTGGGFSVRAAVRPAATGWQAPFDLSISDQNTSAPRIAVNPQGDAVAGWSRSDGAHTIIQGSARPAATGIWSPPMDLSVSDQSAGLHSVAIDRKGNALAVWQRSNATNVIIQAAAFDATGPLLNGLSIPTSGVAGQPLSFAVSPLDDFSALGATSWSFGDGATASGTSVGHTFAAPGSYAVTLTSADALANASTATATVTIAAAAPKLTSVSLSNRRFRVSGRATAVSAKARKPSPPSGTRFRFTLSAAAKLTIAITRSAPGLRSGTRCVAPTAKLRRNHAKRCTRTSSAGTLTRRTMPAGADSVAFSGRIGHRALSPHVYSARLTAANTAGTSKRATVAFTVVR